MLRAAGIVVLVTGCVACVSSSGTNRPTHGRTETAPPNEAAATVPRPSDDEIVDDAFALHLDRFRRAGGSLELLGRLRKDAYSYFRFVAEPFARRVCQAHEDLRWELPSVVLHGDAHLEQFVVTDSTFGLEDFDQSGLGPAVVDLVRFASSVHVVCSGPQRSCDARRLVQAFLASYRDALGRPREPNTVPPVVEKLRRAHPGPSPEAFLQWADSLTTPLEPEVQQRVRRAWQGFVDLMVESDSTRPAAFYRIRRLGALQLGVGSALDTKLLVRIEGPSLDPLDDLVLEAKLQRSFQNVPCVETTPTGGMFRVIYAVVTIGRRVPDVIGWVPISQQRRHPVHYWVNSWDPGYRELEVGHLETAAELEQVVRDVGLQLGSSVVRGVPDAIAGQFRQAHLRALELTHGRVVSLSESLAQEILEAWKRFRNRPPPGSS